MTRSFKTYQCGSLSWTTQHVVVITKGTTMHGDVPTRMEK